MSFARSKLAAGRAVFFVGFVVKKEDTPARVARIAMKRRMTLRTPKCVNHFGMKEHHHEGHEKHEGKTNTGLGDFDPDFSSSTSCSSW